MYKMDRDVSISRWCKADSATPIMFRLCFLYLSLYLCLQSSSANLVCFGFATNFDKKSKLGEFFQSWNLHLKQIFSLRNNCSSNSSSSSSSNNSSNNSKTLEKNSFTMGRNTFASFFRYCKNAKSEFIQLNTAWVISNMLSINFASTGNLVMQQHCASFKMFIDENVKSNRDLSLKTGSWKIMIPLGLMKSWKWPKRSF